MISILGEAAALPSGQMSEVFVNSMRYVICNVDGEFFALDGICPHQGAPLAQGALHGHTIVCPRHGWEFDCRTGRGDCADLQTSPISVENGELQLHA